MAPKLKLPAPPTLMAVGIGTYVDAMATIRNTIADLKDAIKDLEGSLSAAEHIASQQATGVGLDQTIDTTDGSRVCDVLYALEDDCYWVMWDVDNIYDQIDDLIDPEG